MVKVIRDKKGKTRYIESKMKGQHYYFTPSEMRKAESKSRWNKMMEVIIANKPKKRKK